MLMLQSTRLGNTEELLEAGVRDGFLVVESERIRYPLEEKSYSADPEERVRAAVYVWLRRRYPGSTIRLEENRHDLRCTDVGLDMLIECKAGYQGSQDQLRSYLADAGLDRGYFAYEAADGQVQLDEVERTYPAQAPTPQPHKPVVVSLINLKGGVGKTTLLIAIAEILAHEHGKRCLVIDLDPQTNATILLIPQSAWKRKDEAGETLYQLFADRVQGSKKFDIGKAIIHGVSNVAGGIEKLGLLPSSIRLIEIQDQIPNIGGTVVAPASLLNEIISPVLPNYDVVIIDCPPSLSVVTLNGFWISDFCLAPVIPDYLSTWGLPQVIGRIDRFNVESNKNLRLMGIVINMRRRTNLHDTVSDRLKKGNFKGVAPELLFQTEIPHTVRAELNVPMEEDEVGSSEEAFRSSFSTLKQKYAAGLYYVYNEITNEFVHRCNTMLGREVL